MNELQMLQPQVMAILGASLQYLRGYSKFPEWGYHLFAVALSGFGYWLFNDNHYNDTRYVVAYAIVGISGNLSAVWGGTFAASNMAKAGASFIPRTDSK